MNTAKKRVMARGKQYKKIEIIIHAHTRKAVRGIENRKTSTNIGQYIKRSIKPDCVYLVILGCSGVVMNQWPISGRTDRLLRRRRVLWNSGETTWGQVFLVQKTGWRSIRAQVKNWGATSQVNYIVNSRRKWFSSTADMCSKLSLSDEVNKPAV